MSTARWPPQVGMQQRRAANNVLVATNRSAQSAPNFWVDPRNNVSYPLVVQLPTYSIDSAQDLWTHAGDGRDRRQPRPAADERRRISAAARCRMVTSQLNIRPVFDVHADVQGRDLYSAAQDIDKVIAADRPPPRRPSTCS